jgi:asparagine N-glycosylation enzyme membrane subunit Stt3
VIRWTLCVIEIAILSVLILATRCANYQDVFVAGNIYFTDADCYARMTRVQMCSRHPGLIVRHHVFENFPTGTTPHTTAPLDYLVLALSMLLKPFTAHALDLAGALISPLLALLGGWFLWWWSKRMKLRYRWVMLMLYAISPILVHGTEVGRPDHQSLLMLLVTIAVCAEWSLRAEDGIILAGDRSKWSVVSGVAWGLAIWTSAYESLPCIRKFSRKCVEPGRLLLPKRSKLTKKALRSETGSSWPILFTLRSWI